jgi:hypothetical protein
MRTTHFELFQTVLGERYSYLSAYFEAIKSEDINTNQPLDERLFNGIFPPEICAKIFGTPTLDRTTRAQRKMDLTIIRQAYHLWRDKNYFDITPGLCDRLKDTDLKDVDTFFLRTPYRSMYLSLPKGTGLMISNPQSGLHEVESIYLTMDDYGESHTVSIPNRNMTLEGVTKHLHMLVCGETKGLFGDAIMFFDLIFWDGKVSISIEKSKDILENPSLWSHLVEVFNFVVKILLYINCSNAAIRKVAGLDVESKLNGLKNTAKKRKLIQRYSKISPQAHNILDVVISGDRGSSETSDSPIHHLGPKSLERVRRHFKTQRHGPGWSQSKIIWVESYIRGEGAEFYRDKHTYKVI